MRSRDRTTAAKRAAWSGLNRCRMFALIALLASVIANWAVAQEAQPQIPMLQSQAVPPAPGVSAPREVYQHGQVLRRAIGTGEDRVWIFTPDAPRPAAAPVVIFLHGLGGVDPYEYGAWIDHLGRSGNIVIYPIYQKTGMASLMEGASGMSQNAIGSVLRALDDLRRSGPVQPDLSRVTLIAHSFGGQVALALATDGVRRGLPAPTGFMAVETGEGRGAVNPAQIQAMPPSMMLLSVEGENDHLAATRNGRKLAVSATQIPVQRRGFVLLASQNLGGRVLNADHFAPLSPLQSYRLEKTTPAEIAREQAVKQRFQIRNGEVDELDITGFWRLGDALIRMAPNPSATIRDTLNAAGIRIVSEPPAGWPVGVRWAVTPQ
jgi:hypothetical protein